jgi:hypothetical protein
LDDVDWQYRQHRGLASSHLRNLSDDDFDFRQYYLNSSSSSFSTPDSMALYRMMTGIGSLISLGSLLAFVVGFLGLAVRYGAVNKRVHELETITASLVSERDQPSNPR